MHGIKNLGCFQTSQLDIWLPPKRAASTPKLQSPYRERNTTMDKVTVDRLKQLAPLIQKFLDLHPDEQEWLLPLLGRAERRAIKILQEIDNHPLTYKEAGSFTETHPSTVKQTLHALNEGGINFKIDSTGRWLTPNGGRKRKLMKMQ